jgi:hypothetical protein
VVVSLQRSDGGGSDSGTPAASTPPPPAAPAKPSKPAKPRKPARQTPAATTPAKPAKPAKKTPAGPRPVELTALAGPAAGGKGSARIAGGKLELNVTGLPAPHGARYTVWLYNSVIDARPLGSSRTGRISLTAKLPKGASRYRYVDVSLEPADGNPNHSGESILRVPLARLGR